MVLLTIRSVVGQGFDLDKQNVIVYDKTCFITNILDEINNKQVTVSYKIPHRVM